MKYILLNTFDFIAFLLRDIYSLIFNFKVHEYNEFYSRNERTNYRVKSHPCYGTYGDVFYKRKWDAFFNVNKYSRNEGGYSGYFKL